MVMDDRPTEVSVKWANWLWYVTSALLIAIVPDNCISGKTLLAKTLARVLDVPFSQSDATSFTQVSF